MNLHDILACPVCKIHLEKTGAGLRCPHCRQQYPIINGVPVIFPGGHVPAVQHEDELTVRKGYDPWVHRVILQSLFDHQIVLDIGAGNMTLDDPCIIRMDVKLSPYVDLVADAHALPFLPGTLDYIFSLAVFEHLRNPFKAAQSIFESLKDGGFVYHESSFVFAYHGYPHNYFNASLQGMEQVFEKFTALRKGVATYQMPSFALDMVLRTYLNSSRAHEFRHGRRIVKLLEKVLREDLLQYDIYFTEKAALNVAAGVYFAGCKQTVPSATLAPAELVEIWKSTPALRDKYPDINQLTEPDNFFVWAKTHGIREYPSIKTGMAQRPRFNKRGEDAPWNRDKIHGLPILAARFAAMGYSHTFDMAQDSALALRHARQMRLRVLFTLSGTIRAIWKTQGWRGLLSAAQKFFQRKRPG